MVGGNVAIGLYRPKDRLNIGMVLRAMGCFGGDRLLLAEPRFPVERIGQIATDTEKVGRWLPVEESRDLLGAAQEWGLTPVAVEVLAGALPLPMLQHPERALYIFGPEDGDIPAGMAGSCDQRVIIPTPGKGRCLNLAQCVNLVLYDRMVKDGQGPGLEWGYCFQCGVWGRCDTRQGSRCWGCLETKIKEEEDGHWVDGNGNDHAAGNGASARPRAGWERLPVGG